MEKKKSVSIITILSLYISTIIFAETAILFTFNCWASDKPTLEEIKKQDWFLKHLYDSQPYDSQPYLCYMRVDENGWFAVSDNFLKLNKLINKSEKEIIIPIFPTVYPPDDRDKLYYNAILESDIEQNDKVLVIGAGTGSDAWVAWLKSQALIYVIEINPMAIANTYATAQLGGFEVKQILGDIRDIDLPEDFSNFDFVLWNIPFVVIGDSRLEEMKYYDGDDGSLMKSFLTLLPSLLKKDGQAIIVNTKEALKFINLPILSTKTDKQGVLYIYIISNEK